MLSSLTSFEGMNLGALKVPATVRLASTKAVRAVRIIASVRVHSIVKALVPCDVAVEACWRSSEVVWRVSCERPEKETVE